MIHVDTAVILAGGLGTRLRSVVSDVPKPMAPVGEKPFLAYQIEYWYLQGIRQFVLSVGYKYQTIIDYFGHQYLDAKIVYSIENELLGTGGGLLNALEHLSGREHFLVLNGDTFFQIELFDLLQFYEKNQADVLLSVFLSNDVSRYLPLPIVENGKIDWDQRFEVGTGDFWVNGGVYLFRKGIFQSLLAKEIKKCALEQEIFQYLHQSRFKFYAKQFSQRFIDIGVPEDYHKFCEWMTLGV